jgi:hypothetical protein
MNRQTLRDRIVANVRNLNQQLKAPAADPKVPAPRTIVLFSP